jgi:hypothetical protein
VGGGGFGDRGEESVGLRWEGPNTSRPSSSSLSVSLSSLPPHLHHHPSTRCFCLGLLEPFPLVYRDIEGLGAPNCASTPTTQICSLPYYLQKRFVCSAGIQRFWEIWIFVSRLILIIFLGFEVFQLSDKSHIGSECPTFIGYLGSSNTTPPLFLVNNLVQTHLLFSLSLYDSC